MLLFEYGTPAFLKKIWKIFIRNLFEFWSWKMVNSLDRTWRPNYSIIENLILLGFFPEESANSSVLRIFIF